MRILIRVDASHLIGHGHVSRQLALAQSLREKGASVEFACREADGNEYRLITTQGFVLHYLTGAQPEDQSEDVSQVIGKINQTFDWVIVDHYQLGAQWERAIHHRCRNVMAVDDLANRDHNCEILLDQNHYENATSRYRNLVPEQCHLLLGPQYALLRPEFHANRPFNSRTGNVSRLHISFGGSDPARQTSVALGAISVSRFRHLPVDVVIGSSNRDGDRIKILARQHGNATCHVDTREMAKLLAWADLALGAGGVSTNERMSVGVPAIVVATSPLQVNSALDVESLGAHHYIGEYVGLNEQNYLEAIEALIADGDRLANMSRIGLSMVDGLGASRVAEILIEGRHD